MNPLDTLSLYVADIRCEAKDVLYIDLRDPLGGILPPFTPGAHVEVHLKGGLIRHYSLCNDSAERHRYCLGVGLARDGRGGSHHIHQKVRAGHVLNVSAPRNNFPLAASTEESIFIAGGIGITPIMAMIKRCENLGRPWRLFYCARNRQRAAFYEELNTISQGRCTYHFDDENEGRFFDVENALRSIDSSAHIYTCGPGALMKSVESVTAPRPPEHVHFEWFTAAETKKETDQSFTVVLKKSGKRFEVPAGRSILEVLEDNAMPVPYSCREGLCASCKTGVVSGEPDHRDNVLSASEKASGKNIMVCVSRSKSAELVLDI